jgi:hypothetical protein
MRRSAKYVGRNFKDIHPETPRIDYEKHDKNIAIIHVGTYEK